MDRLASFGFDASTARLLQKLQDASNVGTPLKIVLTIVPFVKCMVTHLIVGNTPDRPCGVCVYIVLFVHL